MDKDKRRDRDRSSKAKSWQPDQSMADLEVVGPEDEIFRNYDMMFQDSRPSMSFLIIVLLYFSLLLSSLLTVKQFWTVPEYLAFRGSQCITPLLTPAVEKQNCPPLKTELPYESPVPLIVSVSFCAMTAQVGNPIAKSSIVYKVGNKVVIPVNVTKSRLLDHQEILIDIYSEDFEVQYILNDRETGSSEGENRNARYESLGGAIPILRRLFDGEKNQNHLWRYFNLSHLTHMTTPDAGPIPVGKHFANQLVNFYSLANWEVFNTADPALIQESSTQQNSANMLYNGYMMDRYYPAKLVSQKKVGQEHNLTDAQDPPLIDTGAYFPKKVRLALTAPEFDMEGKVHPRYQAYQAKHDYSPLLVERMAYKPTYDYVPHNSLSLEDSLTIDIEITVMRETTLIEELRSALIMETHVTANFRNLEYQTFVNIIQFDYGLLKSLLHIAGIVVYFFKAVKRYRAEVSRPIEYPNMCKWQYRLEVIHFTRQLYNRCTVHRHIPYFITSVETFALLLGIIAEHSLRDFGGFILTFLYAVLGLKMSIVLDTFMTSLVGWMPSAQYYPLPNVNWFYSGIVTGNLWSY